jgi:plastocyanin
LEPVQGEKNNMKRFTFLALLVVSAMLLSSCGLHLGLGSILNPSSGTAKPAVKKIKATHTPPAPGSSAKATTAADSNATPAASSADTISIKDSAFTPNNLEVAVGTTVTWINNDTTQHTVTSDTNLFDSGPIDPGNKFTYTFTQAGTFAFHCTIQTSMTGTITVQ